MSGFVHMVLNQFPLNELLLGRLRDMGISGFRVGGDAAFGDINPAPDTYNFARVDEAMETAIAYGDVFSNVGGIPAHAVHGLTTYSGGLVSQGGCIRFKNEGGGVGADNLEYAHDLDYCENPPLDIDRQVMFKLGAALAGRPWAPRVKWAGIGNELDDPNFPTKHLIDRDWRGDWNPAAQHSHLFIVKPFADGWRSVLPSTKIMGPEGATAGYTVSMYRCQTRNLLEGSPLLEANANAKMIHDAWTPGHVYDVLSGHFYANGGAFPIDALDRIYGFGGYIAYLKEAGWTGDPPLAGGEVDIEDATDPGTIPQYIEGMWAMHIVEFITLYSPHRYFGDGTENGLKTQLAAGKCEPNQLFGSMQKTLSRIASRDAQH